MYKITLCMLLFLVWACREPDTTPEVIENLELTDWTDQTHGNKVAPDYETVFPQNKVNTIEIYLGSVNWQAIQTDMQVLYGFSFGTAQGSGRAGFPDGEPGYVAAPVKFNGKEWYKVGFRLKGNSTLSSSWRNGIYKLPFRLNFDRFEDIYPQLKNQRFFGFKELSLSPGANDASLIREKAGADIFRMAGIPSAQTAFYKVFIDFGKGLTYCGVYTVVEVVDDTMIKNQFGSDAGNIYKPESDFVNFIISKFEKKNNKDAADYSDVVALINTLHSTLRLQNPEQWREHLEAAFNVNHFLKWLAINTTMQNWDTYGRMAHNYYLYNHPVYGLTWIPWDNNESLSNRGNTMLTIGLETVTSQWPLIRYLMDDPVYAARYRFYMQQFLNEVFNTATINSMFNTYYNLISPFVIGPQLAEQGKYSQLPNPAAFTSAQSILKQHVATRIQVATEYLQTN
ncbi:MAG: CotH kinase family protein [Cyclobacteriaceae bacterium]|nr:CotH kinase family protein [Cyclobacteriaceae bacterium]